MAQIVKAKRKKAKFLIGRVRQRVVEPDAGQMHYDDRVVRYMVSHLL